MKMPLSLRLLHAGLCGIVSLFLQTASAPLLAQTPTGPQQLVFTGLRSVAQRGQFNAVQTDSAGDIYLLLDQGDGVRLLKTDPTATNILAQIQIGATGDIGLAMAQGPSGNLYITGTTTSGQLQSTSGAAFPAPADGTANSFIGGFDQNLNEIFLTYAGSGRTTATDIAATSDAVFVTGSIFTNTLPVTSSAIIQAPAAGSTQNGFVERFNITGTALIYASYLGGLNGNTAPSAIAADSSDNAYITGYTTSSGYPTLNALVPDIIPAAPGTTSGFLTKLTPAGDGIIFSTFIPGAGLSSIALDPATQTLVLSGSIALGQFPVASVSTPIVNTTYQSLLRLSLDGSTLLSSTLLAPGTQSFVTPSSNNNVWVTSSSAMPAWLLPLDTLSTMGNSYALRVIEPAQNQTQIDQAMRFGGLPAANPTFASAPVALTSVAVDAEGNPIFAGSASPAASASLLSTETWDLPLYNAPTAALPSSLHDAVLPPGSCDGSLCAGSAAYLARAELSSAPSLALSTDTSPNLTLRNLGTLAATSLQISSTAFAVTSDCPATLNPAAECDIILAGNTSGSLTVQADNAATQTITLPAPSTQANPIAFSPKELDFGIETSTSPAATQTITVTNLSSQPQTFTSALGSNQITPYTFAVLSSDCTSAGVSAKSLAAGASCHITLSFTASSNSTSDGFAQSDWTIGAGAVLLTGYSQATSLIVSAPEIDFGTQYGVGAGSGLRLPRYLYLSNNSASPIQHTPVALSAPFVLSDNCPTTLVPHSVCQLGITYDSTQSPSADSTTLTLDEGIAVLITGSTLPQPTGIGESSNPALAVTPTTITFPSAVPVTGTSSTTQAVTVANTGVQPFPLSLTLTGDFTYTTNCPAALNGGQSCSVILTFAPSQPGTRNGLLSVSSGAATAPVYVSLTGTASPILPTTNDTLAFGNVILSQPSVLWYKVAQSFTTLTAAIPASDFKAILVEDIGYGHGQPATTAFASTFTGSCSNCWLGVQFTPTNIGAETATLNLSSGSSGNLSPITLTGTGTPATGLILTPTAQDFGPVPVHSTSAPVLFTLTNQSGNTVSLAASTLTGDFALSTLPTGGSACAGTLAPSASCFLNLVFTPTSDGPRTGALTLQTSDGNSISSTLTGYGNPDPGLALNPIALVFNNVPGSSALQQTITLTNTGFSALQIAAPTNATQSFASSSNCASLAPSSSCSIIVTFTPGNADVTDTLQIPVTSTNGLTTYAVPLTGAYTLENAGLQILPGQVIYAPASTETLGTTQQFTINNLTAKSLTLNIALPRQFMLSGAPCAALAPNASCQFSATFLPLTNNNITGTLFATGSPTDGSATLNGLGYVEGYGLGSGSLAISGNLIPNDPVLDFGQVASGQSSSQTLTLTNQGTNSLTVRRLTSQWPFLISSTTCGAALAAGQSCTATLAYTPLNQAATGSSPRPNADSGLLTVESDSLTSPDTLNLTGTATPILTVNPGNLAPLVTSNISQGSLTFPTTQVGDQSTAQTLTLANTGTTVLHISALQTTPDFTLQSSCTSPIVPGASCTISISFTPQAAASPSSINRIGALEITSDSSNALDFVSLLGTASPPTLTFTPLSLSFGTVQVGSSSTLPIQVANTGTTPATFNSVTSTGDYAVAGTCPTSGNTLAPSASCTLEVTFTPTQTGARSGTLSLASSTSTLPLTAALTGTGTASHLQITPSNLSFGSIAVGASSSLTLTLANNGTAPLTGITFTPTGDYAVTIPCASQTLAPGASCQITVAFTPTALGDRSATLTVTSSDPSFPAVIPLTGTGVPNGSFLLTVNGGSSATQTVVTEHPAGYNLQLTPQSGFVGTVVLNCTPITPGQYTACSILPSSVSLSGASQTATATITTITATTPGSAALRSGAAHLLLCLIPMVLLFPRRLRIRIHPILRTFIILAPTVLLMNGCGSGGDPSLLRTPPGTYQYQVTASSTNGQILSQTVTLNLIVTAK